MDENKMNEINEALRKLSEDLDKLQRQYDNQKEEVRIKEEELERIISGNMVGNPYLEEEIRNLRSEQWSTLTQLNELKARFQHISALKTEDLEKTVELPKVDLTEETIKPDVEINSQSEEIENIEMVDEDLEKTLELDQDVIQKNLEKTEELKQSNLETIKQVKPQIDVSKISVLFEGSKGWYKIKYAEDKEPKIYGIEKNLLNENSPKSIELRAKYGNNIDVCLVNALEQFDKEFNTNTKDMYVNSTLKTIYDFRGFKSVNKEFLNSKDKKNFKTMVNNSKESHNTELVTLFSNKKLKKAVVTFGLITGGAVALSSLETKDNTMNNETTQVSTTEVSSEKEVENVLERITENPFEDLEKTDKLPIITPFETLTEVTTQSTTEEEIETITTEENTTETEIKEEKVEQITEEQTIDYKVGDKVTLENVDIYSSSLYDGPKGNTANINSNNFEVSIIAITYGSEIVDVIRDSNESINSLREKYEKIYDSNINIAVNVNVLDENGNVIQKNVGWFNSNNLYNNNDIVKTR